MLKSRPGRLPRLMDAKSSVWVRKSAWHLFDQQIKLRAGYCVLNSRHIELLPQKLQNLSVVGVVGHFVLLGNQSYSRESPKCKRQTSFFRRPAGSEPPVEISSQILFLSDFQLQAFFLTSAKDPSRRQVRSFLAAQAQLRPRHCLQALHADGVLAG